MKVRPKKMGNSTAPIVPPPALKDLGIGVVQTMTMDTTPDGKSISSPKRRYTLAELIARCDLKAAPPRDLALWNAARVAGQEVEF